MYVLTYILYIQAHVLMYVLSTRLNGTLIEITLQEADNACTLT